MEERLILSDLYKGDMTETFFHKMMKKLSGSLSFFSKYLIFNVPRSTTFLCLMQGGGY